MVERLHIAKGQFTLTSADILGTTGNIYQHTTPLGVGGKDGFQNTFADTWLGDGYYANHLSADLVAKLTGIYIANGLDPNNSTGYVWSARWAETSSTPTSLVKIGFSSGNGDPANSFLDIQVIDLTDDRWTQAGTANGRSLVGTFMFPATFTLYLPLLNKSGWC